LQSHATAPAAPVAALTVPVHAPAAAPGPRHRWPLLHLAARSFGLAFRLLPRRFRFAAAVLASRVLVPLIRRTAAYREQSGQRIDTAREISLFRVMESLTASGTLFDPVLRVEGMHHLVEAVRGKTGVLMAGPHSMLSLLVLRRIHDLGWPQTVISPTTLRATGTREDLPCLAPSPAFLITVRSVLRSGGLVCAMLDRGEPRPRRLIAFDTAQGPVRVADAFIPLALRCGARVVFLGTRMRGRHVAVRFAVPSPASDTAEQVTADFVEFVREHVASHAENGPAAAPKPAPAAGEPRRARKRAPAGVA
jgi:hypothetical protein